MSKSIAPLAPEAIKELNEILEDAKLKLCELEQYRNSENPELSRLKSLYDFNTQAWGDLRKKLGEVTPVVFICEDGTKKIIGTAGHLSSDLMLYYSPNENSRYKMEEQSLSGIKSFLKA